MQEMVNVECFICLKVSCGMRVTLGQVKPQVGLVKEAAARSIRMDVAPSDGTAKNEVTVLAVLAKHYNGF